MHVRPAALAVCADVALLEPARVAVEIFDLLRRWVALFLGVAELDEVDQRVVFDATVRVSGLYLYRITPEGWDRSVGHTVIREKMLLAR